MPEFLQEVSPEKCQSFSQHEARGTHCCPASCLAVPLRGGHGPALHAAAPAPGRQTQPPLSAHLPALPHQVLMPPRTARTHLWPRSLLSALATLGCLPLTSPRSPPLQALLFPCPSPCRPGGEASGKGCPEAERTLRPHPMFTGSSAPPLPAASPRLGSRVQAGPPFPGPGRGGVCPVY